MEEPPPTLDYLNPKEQEPSGCRDCLVILSLYAGLAVLVCGLVAWLMWYEFA